MDDTIPLLIGAVVAIVAVRWYFGRDDGQNNEPAAETVTRLQAMFPNVPAHVIREEVRRANGSLSASIDRLLQVAERFPSAPPQTSPDTSTPSIKVDPPKAAATHRDIIGRISANDKADATALPSVDRTSWERDAQARQALLTARKEAMLREARQRMINKGE